jgi:hypothetical protein
VGRHPLVPLDLFVLTLACRRAHRDVFLLLPAHLHLMLVALLLSVVVAVGAVLCSSMLGQASSVAAICC